MLKLKIIYIFVFLFLITYLFPQTKAKDYYYKSFDTFKEQGKWDYCENILKEALKDYPDELNFYLLLNYSLRNQKKFDESISIIKPIYEKFKNHKDVINHYKWSLQELGWQKYNEKKMEEGLKLFETAYNLDSSDEWNIVGYGVMLTETKQVDTAIKLFEAGMSAFPDNKYIKGNYINALQSKGWELNKNNEKKEALSFFEKSYLIDNDNEWSINGYGYILRETGELMSAAEILKKGYEKYGQNKYIKENLLYTYILIANGYRDKKEYTKAEEFYNIAGNIDYNNESWIINYGIFLRYSNNFKKAFEVLSKGEKLFPSNNNFKENIKAAYYEYGDFLNKSSNQDRALEVYLEASKKFSNEFYLYYHIVAIYIKKEDLVNASKFLIKMAETGDHLKNTDKKIEDYQHNIYYRLNEILTKLANIKKTQEGFDLINNIEKYFSEKYLVYQCKGNFTYHSGDKQKGLDLVYHAYDLFIATNQKYKAPIVIDLPLKGIYFVGGNSRRDAITHAGLNRYCYDFSGSDINGSFTKLSLSFGEGENEDYYGFGDPIYSPIDGIVEDVYDDKEDLPPSKNYKLIDGNSVTIKDENGLHYIFVHTKKNSAKFKKGDAVKKGQIIANIGNSGMTTAAHLHFGVYSENWLVSIPVKFNNYSILEKNGNKKKIVADYLDDKVIIISE